MRFTVLELERDREREMKCKKAAKTVELDGENAIEKSDHEFLESKIDSLRVVFMGIAR